MDHKTIKKIYASYKPKYAFISNKIRKRVGSHNKREFKIIDEEGSEYKFSIETINGFSYAVPLFIVKDNFHMYSNGDVCLSKDSIMKKDIEVQLENWVEAYKIYKQFGFSGYPESNHKKYNKNKWKE